MTKLYYHLYGISYTECTEKLIGTIIIQQEAQLCEPDTLDSANKSSDSVTFCCDVIIFTPDPDTLCGTPNVDIHDCNDPRKVLEFLAHEVLYYSSIGPD